MKTWIIANPKAGSAGKLDDLHERCGSLSADQIHVTAGAGEAESAARRALDEGCERIVVAGGDGTLNEVINGIADRAGSCAIALLPLGTGNDFARSLGLPAAFEECVDVVCAGKTAPVDLVRATCDQVRHFVNISAGGFSGLVSDKLTPDVKRSWGPLAYLRGAAEAFSELRAYRTDILLDDLQPISLELYNVVVANGRYVAGGIPIAPEAQINDGQLDIVLIPKLTNAEIALSAAQILMGKHLANEAIVFRRAAKVHVESSPGMWFNVDGEMVSDQPMTFEVMPSALRFVVP